MLFRCNKVLVEIHIIDAKYASLYTYDQDKDVIRAFCENWCPATNTPQLVFEEAFISKTFYENYFCEIEGSNDNFFKEL